jgi:ABC-2 type transport system ATP-binding protein
MTTQLEAPTAAPRRVRTDGADQAPAEAIVVRDLVKRYPKSAGNAVDGVSFSVRRGEIFGLLGPNGAGKSTTIGVLTTNVRPTGGKARIMGMDVVRHPQRVKQRIAVVPQQSNLDRSLKVREILTFHAAYHGVPRKEREARADALLDELGLGARKNDRVLRYSGGMSQRVMIARALMHAPDVLFLDEPTNNLDPQSRLFLWDRIRALNAAGLTILLTTHDMEEADQLCERIAIMDYGTILVNDTAEELKKLIPGGNTLELRVRIPGTAIAGVESVKGANGADSPALLAGLQALPGVIKVDEIATGSNGPRHPDGSPEGGGGPGSGRGAPWGAWAGSPGSPGSGQPPEAEPGVVTYRVYAQDTNGLAGAAVQVVQAAGAEVRDLHLKRASLEEVFIYLTGRQLR